MLKYIVFLTALFLLNSCGLPYDRLDGGNGNKVPKKNFKFSNKKNIDIYSFKKNIEIDFFYEVDEIYESDRNFNFIGNHKIKGNGLIQYYENVCVRTMNKKFMNPDPQKIGGRGIIYSQNGILNCDIFSGGYNNKMYVETYKIKIENNKYYFLQTHNLSGNMCYVYVKGEKVPEEYKKYEAIW